MTQNKYKIRKLLSWVVLTIIILSVIVQGYYLQKTKEQQRIAQQHLQRAIEGSQNGLWDWSNVPEDKSEWFESKIWCSGKFSELLGIQEDIIKFGDIVSRLHPDDIEPTIEAIKETLLTGEPCELDFQMKYGENKYRWYRANAIRTIDKDGSYRLSGSIIDATDAITERLRADLIILSAPSAIIMCNHEGEITVCNSAAEKLFGWTMDELYGQSIQVLITDEYRDNHNEAVKETVSNLKIQDGDWIVTRRNIKGDGICKDGSIIPLRITVRAIKYRGTVEFVASMLPIEPVEPDIRLDPIKPSSIQSRSKK